MLARAARHRDLLGAGAIVFVALLVHWRALGSGGLYLDDWWQRGAALYAEGSTERSGPFGYLKGLNADFGFRPGLVAVMALEIWLAAGEPQMYQVLVLGNLLLAAFALLAALRLAHIPALPAAAAAVLFACVPIAASTRFWLAGGIINVAFGIALGAAALGILGLRDARPRARRPLLGASVALFAAAALAYETIAGPMALLPLLYRVATDRGWRVVLAKAGADCIAVLFALALFRTSDRTDAEPVSAWPEHARDLAVDGATLFLRTLTPERAAGVATALVLAAAAVALAVRVARHRSGWASRARAEVREPGRLALVLLGAGIALALLGYLVLVPAAPFYNPLTPGQGDRTNGVSAAGFALAYAGIALGLATVLAAGAPRLARDALFGTLVALAAVSFVQQSRGKGDQYVKAWRMASALAAEIPPTFPQGPPPPGTMIFSFGATGYAAPLVEALGGAFAMDGAAKLALRTGEIEALPILAPQPVICGRDGVSFPTQNAGGPVFTPAESRRYGSFVFMDAFAHRAEAIRSRAQCQDALSRYEPGPLF